MTDYWIKLYHEIIDDPKMATLPDRLWRRTIELFLLAGRLCHDKSGELPDTHQLAWLLRVSTDDLQTDLIQLASTGIIENIPGGWLVVNFQKRQSAATSTERVKQYRERKQKQQYYDNETNLKRNVTQINRLTETETESETEQIKTTSSSADADFGEVVRVFEQNIGVITPRAADQIGEDVSEYGKVLVLSAIDEAVRQNVKKWSYVQGILRRWKVDGKTTPQNGKHQEYQGEVILPDYIRVGKS